MKREFLKDLGLEKALVDKIIDVNSADIGRHKAQAFAAQAKLSQLESKYSADCRAWESKKQQFEYETRRNAFFESTPFADIYSKKGVYAEFDRQQFKYSEDKKCFLGADEWLKRLRASAPKAFKKNAKILIVVKPQKAIYKTICKKTGKRNNRGTNE